MFAKVHVLIVAFGVLLTMNSPSVNVALNVFGSNAKYFCKQDSSIAKCNYAKISMLRKLLLFPAKLRIMDGDFFF